MTFLKKLYCQLGFLYTTCKKKPVNEKQTHLPAFSNIHCSVFLITYLHIYTLYSHCHHLFEYVSIFYRKSLQDTKRSIFFH